ncbi:MAG: hypothetical protein M1818_007052 [Claussenomyces sp. TS43310]|nr:MAG: hypothetical protein M1818_007052 [Claussenomyces sp. TS43310]
MNSQRLSHRDYHVGWVCALQQDLTVAKAMLDADHPSLPNPPSDYNVYHLGRIGAHNVVIVCLSKGETGMVPAATVATQMTSTYPSIRFGLSVGMGGGAPSVTANIRLGDVVVSSPRGSSGGVGQYDHGKNTPRGFIRTGFLSPPSRQLRAVLNHLGSKHELGGNMITKYLSEMFERYPQLQPRYSRPAEDMLFEATYNHIEHADDNCAKCDRSKARDQRQWGGTPDVHYGLIISGQQVMRNALARDRVSTEFGGALCFETIAAGLMNSFPCIVIRGIANYADSHKHKIWNAYAAATAAAFAKELLSEVPVHNVEERSQTELLDRRGAHLFQSFKALWDILKETICHPDLCIIYYILDSLGKCEETFLELSFNAIKSLFLPNVRTEEVLPLHLIATSRDFPDMTSDSDRLLFRYLLDSDAEEEVIRPASSSFEQFVVALLQRGADVCATDAAGRTAAAYTDHEAMKSLLEAYQVRKVLEGEIHYESSEHDTDYYKQAFLLTNGVDNQDLRRLCG